MRRRGIEVVVIFLGVLAVISLIAGQPEQPFFQNRIAAVPEGQREAQTLVVVADSRDAIFAPAIRPQVRVLEWEKLPRGAVLAVILANRSPCALGQVRAPAPPMLFPPQGFVQTPFLGFHEALILANGMPRAAASFAVSPPTPCSPRRTAPAPRACPSCGRTRDPRGSDG